MRSDVALQTPFNTGLLGMHSFLPLFRASHRKGSRSDPPLRVDEAIIDCLQHIVFILLMKHQKAPSINKNPPFPFPPSDLHAHYIPPADLMPPAVLCKFIDCRCLFVYIIDVVGSQLFQSQQHLVQPVQRGPALTAARQGLQLRDRSGLLLQITIPLVFEGRNQILQ